MWSWVTWRIFFQRWVFSLRQKIGVTCGAEVISGLRSHRGRSRDGCRDDHRDLRVGTAQQQTDSDGREGLLNLWWVSAHGWSLTRAQRASRWGSKKKTFCFLSLSFFLPVPHLTLRVCNHSFTVMQILFDCENNCMNEWLNKKGKYAHTRTQLWSNNWIFNFMNHSLCTSWESKVCSIPMRKKKKKSKLVYVFFLSRVRICLIHHW